MKSLPHKASQCLQSPGGRRGVFLIDMVVTITISAVLMFTAGLLLIRLLTVAPTAQRQLEQRAAVDRLGAQLRRDAHAASSAELGPDQNVLTLHSTPETEIQYAIEERAIRRTQTRGGKIEARDTYWLPASKPIWHLDEKAQPPELALLLTKQKGANQKVSGVDLDIHAVVGRDHRVGQP